MIFWSFLLAFALIFQVPTHASFVTGTRTFVLNKIIQRVEHHKENWTALKAHLELDFINQDHRVATCNGSLLYHRLDERLLLKCFNESNNLVMAFQAEDRDFDLYIPGRETVFSGSIFDLENTEEIESHLKALSLYRALKTMVIPKDHSEVEKWEQNLITLKVLNPHVSEQNKFVNRLARRLFISPAGEVQKEVYYSLREDPLLTIFRSRFDQFDLEHEHLDKSVAYPKSISIKDHTVDKSLQLSFNQIEFFSMLEGEVWKLDAPETSQKVNLAQDLINQNRR